MRLWTVGHSTRSLDELAGLLKAHGVGLVADVRRFPGSRKHPQFGREALERGLSERGVGYVWLGETLGGRRKPGPEAARHRALRNDSFRAYAAHMETPQFREGVERLLELGSGRAAAVLCSEAVWWRCHRSMIADFLTAAGHEVLHIMTEKRAQPHRLRPEARKARGRLVYDRRQENVSLASSAQDGRRRRARL
jgi:uncharacterized protein (DUF488 family)